MICIFISLMYSYNILIWIISAVWIFHQVRSMHTFSDTFSIIDHVVNWFKLRGPLWTLRNDCFLLYVYYISNDFRVGFYFSNIFLSIFLIYLYFPNVLSNTTIFIFLCCVIFFIGLSKFAKLARSVTRSRSVLVSQFSSHIPAIKDSGKQSNFAHVRIELYSITLALSYLCLLVYPLKQTCNHPSLFSLHSYDHHLFQSNNHYNNFIRLLIKWEIFLDSKKIWFATHFKVH